MVIKTINFLIQQGGWVPREDLIQNLQKTNPNIKPTQLRPVLSQATRVLEPKGYGILIERTRLKKPTSEEKYASKYKFGTIEEKSKYESEKKAATPKRSKKTNNLRAKPFAIDNIRNKPKEKRFESPELTQQKLERDSKKMEEQREFFISKFSSSILALMDINLKFKNDSTHTLTGNLYNFLIQNSPFNLHEKEKFIKLIGGASIEFMRDFFLEALHTQLTRWYGIEPENMRAVPQHEREAVRICAALKTLKVHPYIIVRILANHFKILTQKPN